MKIVTYLLIILFTASCSLYSPTIKITKEGSYETLAGTKDGCDSSISARGNSFYRMFYSFQQRPELMHSHEYFDAWYRGYIYCFHFVNRRQFTPIDNDLQPGYYKFWSLGKNENPKVAWPWDQGVPMIDHGIKFPGEGDFHWNNLFVGCKTIFC